MEGKDHRQPRPRLRALELIEEHALGERLAGSAPDPAAVA
jgi:hypothetical protein